MFGGLLSLLSAITFSYATASVRRGVLTGTVFQAVAISLPVALPFFAAVMLATGGFPLLKQFPAMSVALLAGAGVLHFGWARYCNYRATKAMGANLVAPVQQFSLIFTLALAVILLGERMTVLRLFGIGLVMIGPAVLLTKKKDRPKPASLSAAASGDAAVFTPDLAEGYLYALLSSIGFGISPIMIRMAFTTKTIAAGVAGGFISYAAATVAVGLLLLIPAQHRAQRGIDAHSAKWFAVSGVAVCFSQMLRYMALAVAPVSVVTPIQRLSLVFRIYFGRIINPDHEVFDSRLLWATALSLVGALALSVSSDGIIHLVPLPDWLTAVVGWHWP